MPTLAERLRAAALRLELITETPRLDAEILLAHALGVTRAQLLARLREDAPSHGFDELLQRRLAYEPIAYVTGIWEFFSLEFQVRPPVFVPRPETEHLVEAALDHIRKRALDRPRVLDLGTGTGCIAISIAKHAPGAEVTATDINPDALSLAHENAVRHKTSIRFLPGDLFRALGPETTPFDVIVSNPPYVEAVDWSALSPVIRLHEDPRALLAGPDGLAVIRRIIQDTPKQLVSGGFLALEIGERQRDAVERLLRDTGFRNVRFARDLAGIPRIAAAECA